MAAASQVEDIKVQIRSGKNVRTVSSPIAPPIFNGGFEIDSFGAGTPDGWATDLNEAFIHLLQQPDLPFPLHEADGVLDENNPAQGKRSLRLNGVVEFPNRWCQPKDHLGPMKAYCFNTAQTLILKPSVRYRVIFQYRMAGDDGFLELRSVPWGECFVDMERLFPDRRVKSKNSNHEWENDSFEFDMPSGKSTASLVFVNHSKQPVWIDDVKVAEDGSGKDKRQGAGIRGRRSWGASARIAGKINGACKENAGFD